MMKTEPEDADQGGARARPTRRRLERKAALGDGTGQGVGQQAREVAKCRASNRPVRWVEFQDAVPDGAHCRMAPEVVEHAQGIPSKGGASVRNGEQAIDLGARQRHSQMV